jgi:hypothetical protein
MNAFIINASLMDLINLAKTLLNDQVMEKVSGTIGADKAQTQDASEGILDLLLGGLAKNASTPEGAEQLDKAVSEDHDGGLLDNLGDYFNGNTPANLSPKATNATGILKHILGDKQDAWVDMISQKTGMNKEQVMALLIKLAPIAMSMLGKAKKDTGTDAGGLAGLLKSTAQKQQETSGFMGIVGKFLDKDGDGSYMDDLMAMAAKKFMG